MAARPGRGWPRLRAQPGRAVSGGERTGHTHPTRSPPPPAARGLQRPRGAGLGTRGQDPGRRPGGCFPGSPWWAWTSCFPGPATDALRLAGEGSGTAAAGPGRAGAEVTDRAALRLRPSAVFSPAPCSLLPRGSRGSAGGAGLFAFRYLPKAPPETPPGHLLSSSLLAGNFLGWLLLLFFRFLFPPL